MTVSTAVPWLAPAAPDLVWFSGADSVRFLNDLISQEIGDMAPGDVRRSLLLSPKGKVDHLLWVVKTEEGVGLITDPGRGTLLIETVSRFKIRVDVTIEPESEDVWLVMGDGDGVDISWPGVPRRLVIGNKPDLRSGSSAEYEAVRIGAGEPAYGTDVSENSIPQEIGLVGETVDFTKGCFLGQELVARINSRGGNVPRPLRLLDLDGEAQPGTEIVYDGSPVGVLTSVAGTSGIGVLKRLVEPGEMVEIGAATALVRELPEKPQE